MKSTLIRPIPMTTGDLKDRVGQRLGLSEWRFIEQTDVNAFGERAGNGRYYSRPTAAYDPRQFQFGAKFSF